MQDLEEMKEIANHIIYNGGLTSKRITLEQVLELIARCESAENELEKYKLSNQVLEKEISSIINSLPKDNRYMDPPDGGDVGKQWDHEANARRIVACVNACAGISTDSLEKFTITDLSEIGGLAAQRDELLAALKNALDGMADMIITIADMEGVTLRKDLIISKSLASSPIGKVREAIAKAVQP